MVEPSNCVIKKVFKEEDLQKCRAIRHEVFVVGQKVPVHEELDGLDSSSEHYLLFLKGLPAGTARVRYIEDFAKIERVGILEAYQGQGLGHQLMHFILREIGQNPGIKKAKLASQTYAIPFYERLGFILCSEEYLDAGIPHQDMQFELAR